MKVTIDTDDVFLDLVEKAKKGVDYDALDSKDQSEYDGIFRIYKHVVDHVSEEQLKLLCFMGIQQTVAIAMNDVLVDEMSIRRAAAGVGYKILHALLRNELQKLLDDTEWI